MREIRNKQRVWRLVYSRITIGFLAFLFLLGLSAIWNVYGKYQKSAEDRARAEENLQEFEERVTTLTEDVKRLKTKEGVEEEFRSTFGLVKEGEGVIVILDDEGDTEIQEKMNGSFWSSVWQAVTDVFGI